MLTYEEIFEFNWNQFILADWFTARKAISRGEVVGSWNGNSIGKLHSH